MTVTTDIVPSEPAESHQSVVCVCVCVCVCVFLGEQGFLECVLGRAFEKDPIPAL